jgi:formate hydrogenlyase subunit 4
MSVPAGLLSALQGLAAVGLCPLLPGVINRTKALVAGRRGQPLLQGYYDLARLLRKGAVYSRTTGWVFRAGPQIGLAAALAASCIVPWAGAPALLSFEGDLFLFAYLFGLMRFLTMLAALDTGSAFEGMGASREAWFSALSEPGLLLALGALARSSRSLSLSGILSSQGIGTGLGPALVLAAGAFFVVFLAENSRIPVDDPTTHLELTMIHEVMVLDHGGVDLAFIQYGSALKLWATGALVVTAVCPRAGSWVADAAVGLAGMLGLGVAVGLVESVMARLRLTRVPQLLAAAWAMAALALALVMVR